MSKGGGQVRRPKPRRDQEEGEGAEKAAAQDTTEEVEDLLDEIDQVLEENAEEFVRSYVQKGGQ